MDLFVYCIYKKNKSLYSYMLDLKEILDVAKIHPKRAISAYVYGSRIYGTSTDESDWDISLIAKNSVESIEIKSDKYNIHIPES